MQCSLSTSTFRKVILLLCIFTFLFVIRVIQYLGLFANDNANERFTIIHTKLPTETQFLMQPGPNSVLLISEPAANKHPRPIGAVKIWPYKGMASEMMDVDRPIIDSRPISCKDLVYSDDLKPVTVIIPFHNEFIGVILRTLYTILETTPEHLIKEILLADDGSTEFYLFDELEKQAKKLSKKIKILRSRKQIGINKLLRQAIKTATEEIVVIMEPYLEVSHGWLEPLLEPVHKQGNTITVPVIEYQYWYDSEKNLTTTLDGRGVFDLQLNYLELPLMEKIPESFDFVTPIMTKGVFVMQKQFLKQLLNRDVISNTDGNLIELSLNAWTCGGFIQKVPCSKVSHDYKDGGVHDPYDYDKNHKTKELKQLIMTYFDEFSDHYLNFESKRFEKVPVSENEIKSTKKLRRKTCKSFKWFLESVAADMANTFIYAPTTNLSGVLQSESNPEICVGGNQMDEIISFKNCSDKNTQRIFSYTVHQDIRAQNQFVCWTAYQTIMYKYKLVAMIGLQPCLPDAENQRFQYSSADMEIRRIGTDMCLDVELHTKFLHLSSCDVNKATQKWKWI